MARILVSMFTVILIAVIANSGADAQIRFTREVSFAVTIAESQIILNASRELRPESATIWERIIVTVDNPLPNKDWAAQLRQGMNVAASRLTGVYKPPADFYAANPPTDPSFDPSILDRAIPWNLTLDVKASFTDVEGEAARLAAEGFVSDTSKSMDIEDVTYTVTRWSKLDVREAGPFGTAHAVVHLTPEQRPSRLTTELPGRFTLASSIDSITVEGIPDYEGARARSERLRAAYEDDLIGEIQQVLDELNEKLSAPQSFLNDEDRRRFGPGATGTVLEFEKSLNYVWYGEETTVNIVVTATLGPLRFLDLGEDDLIEPFVDD